MIELNRFIMIITILMYSTFIGHLEIINSLVKVNLLLNHLYIEFAEEINYL